MNKNEVLYRLIQAGFDGDRSKVYKLGLRATQLLKKDGSEDLLDKLTDLMSSYSIGHSPLRSIGYDNVPQDVDDRTSLIDVNLDPSAGELIFSEKVWLELDSFLKEREMAGELIKSGLTPPSSLLLHGQPGTGKTKMAEYIAHSLGKPLFVLNLASSISSYLGKTGSNLKAVLDYAQESGAVLLLDEFDSIAKRRDDPGDLGELKRIVNVLLKELEAWDESSVLIAATNHPELLDRAIWRRFDVAMEVGMPNLEQRIKLFETMLRDEKVSIDKIKVLAEVSDGINPALIENAVRWARRKSIVYNMDLVPQVIEALLQNNKLDKSGRGNACKSIKAAVPGLSQKELAKLLSLSPSTVSYHLGKQ